MRDLAPPAVGCPRHETLDLSYCESLEDLSPLGGCAALVTLHAQDCTRLRCVDGLAGAPRLRELDLRFCRALPAVGALGGCVSLEMLLLTSASGLESVDGLAAAPALRELRLERCARIDDVASLAGLVALEELRLDGCTRLRDVAPLASLPRLAELSLAGCTLLGRDGLAGLTGAPALRKLDVRRCGGSGGVSALPFGGRLPRTASFDEAEDVATQLPSGAQMMHVRAFGKHVQLIVSRETFEGSI